MKAAFLVIVLGACIGSARAEMPSPPTGEVPPGQSAPPLPPSPSPDPAATPAVVPERKIPIQRELSDEDYHWLGRVVWEAMQTKVPSEQHRGLSKGEVNALLDAMRRNRDEFNVQLGDLTRILSTAEESAACKPKQTKSENYGFDLDRLRPPQH